MRQPVAILDPKKGEPALAGLAEKTRQGYELRRGLGDAATLLLSPDGSFNRSGPISPTISGGVRVIDGKCGDAWIAGEATTNYCVNPQFGGIVPQASNAWDTALNGPRVAITSWSSYNAGVSQPGIGYHAHPLPGEGPEGSTAIALYNINSQFGMANRYLAVASGMPQLVGPVIATGSQITISFDYKAEALGLIVTPGIYRRSKATGALTFTGSTGNVASTKVNEWERKSITYTVVADWDTAQLASIYMYGQNGPEGRKWIANVQVEVKGYPTPLAVGDMGAGHAWVGPVRASASTRASAQVATSIVHTAAGAVYIRARSGFGARSLDYWVVAGVANLGQYGPNDFMLGGVGNQNNANYGPAIPLHTDHVQGVEWDGDKFCKYLNEQRIQPMTTYGGAATVGSTNPVRVVASAADYVESVVMFDRQLTDAERSHLLQMQRSWEWGDDGSLTLPTTGTIGEVYIRFRAGAGPVQAMIMRASGPLSDDIGTLEILPAGVRITATGTDLEVLGLVALAMPLDPWQRVAMLRLESWTEDELLGRFAPPAPFRTGLVRQQPISIVTVAGEPTLAESWTTRHGVNQPVGSASLTIPDYRGLSHLDINAPIEIQAGYRNGSAQRVFIGRIVRIERSLGGDGRGWRVQAEDWTSLLDFVLEDDLVFRGRTTFTAIFRAIASMRRLPLYRADRVLTPSGLEVAFGGVTAIDDGDVIIPARTSPLTWMSRKARLFGYRVFGQPVGPTALSRLSGVPAAVPGRTFTEGVDLLEVGQTRSSEEMVTAWTVYGARYTDNDGVSIELKAIPGTVPPDHYLTPPGYRSGEESDSILDRQYLVDAVRQVQEIDHAAIHTIAPWTTWGTPEIQPGDVIQLAAPSVGISAPSTRWVMEVSHHWSRSGFTTDLSGWAGGGQPLPPGIDEETIPIGSGTYRLGDEYLPHYVVPSGTKRERVVIPFTVPGTYTSLALVGRQHGTNSYLIDGANTDATVSTLEVHQGGESVGSAQLPMSPENLSQAIDYRDRSKWDEFRMPIPGTIEEGPAELHIISGKDSRIADHFALDDFEAEALGIEARGIGRPILPERW